MIEPVRFVFNDCGEKVAVVIRIDEYEKLLETLGNVDDIRAHQEAKASGESCASVEEAIARIERSR